MGDILEIQGADVFRVNAYRKAALTISNMAFDLRQTVDQNPHTIKGIRGIGKHLSKKIIELIQTGKCKEYEKMKKGFPKGLLDMLRLRGLGPKKVKLFYSKLKITNIKQLKKAAETHKLCELDGMGEKSEEDILLAIQEYSQFTPERHLIVEAMHEAVRYMKYLRKCKFIKNIEYAGSLRRAQDTIGDIDLLVTVRNPKKSQKIVMKHFVEYDEVLSVIAEGDTKSSVVLQSGINVDLRVVAEQSFGAALHYFTGSKQHNIRVRDLAKRKKLKLNEYGLFKGKKLVGGLTEQEIFDAVGLPFIEPELRNNNGEIEYGLKNKSFPKLVELKDIKGDLHTHSLYSDGKNTIEEMAQFFIRKGYEYFAVTDHSSVMGVTQGMGSKDIKEQWQEISRLNKKFRRKIKILKGCEVDILKDGSLDFSDEVLKNLDVVIIAAHMYGRLDLRQQTKRLIAAIENPYSMILAHPTGRLINRRPEMTFDMEKIIDACVENKVAIEINSNPLRLDLVDKYIKIAKDKGAKFVIDTDSHTFDQAEFIKFGVGIARRGWLEKNDILNTRNLDKFDSYFR